MLKAAIKHASDVDKVRHRTLPPEQVAQWATKLEELKDEVAAILKEEKEEIEHEKEMFSRPALTWFRSEKEKLIANGAPDVS